MDSFIIETRKYLHQNPEIGYNTHNTAKFVYNTLKSFKFSPIYAMDNTAVLCEINLNKPKTLGLRSDMDALEIKEETNTPFSSNNNYMHACGHDCHMTIMLYLAKLISENLDKINYNIIFLFQPAEEGPLPGGAYYLKDHPLLKKVDYFLAYHVSPKLEVGKCGIKFGEAMASPDLWQLELTGVGCHGARPQDGNNPILPASLIALELEKFHQEYKKKENIVISTTYINSGVSKNIILPKAYLKGTARSFRQEIRDDLNIQMTNIIKTICDKYNIEYKFDFEYAYPPVYNDIKLANSFMDSIQKVLGKDNAIYLDEPELVGEDFAYYNEIAPLCLAWIGAKPKDMPYYGLHSNKFCPPFETILYGSNILFDLITKDSSL